MFEDYEREDLVDFYFEEKMYWQEVAEQEYFERRSARKSGMGNVDEAYINDAFEYEYSYRI